MLENIHRRKGRVVFISGRMPSPKILHLTDCSHTLIIESDSKDKLPISQLVAYNYFNDLLTYHFINTKKGNKKDEDQIS
jgi:DNA-binding MurR/RpiR family transcriptional regulator